MKKILSRLTLAAVLSVGFGLTACTDEKSAEATPKDAPADHSEHAAVQTVCPVSGEELGSMGEPVVMTHDGKEVKLCCKSCIKKFEADPATYTAKVH
jgi:hypothetical protein